MALIHDAYAVMSGLLAPVTVTYGRALRFAGQDA
jgi:acetyl esterase